MLGAGSFVPTSVTRLTIGLRAQEHIQQSQFQPLVGVDPLQTTWLERGAVRSRVALLLRSSETQPLFNDLSTIDGSCPQASDQSPPGACSRGCCCWLAGCVTDRLSTLLIAPAGASAVRGQMEAADYCSRGCCCLLSEGRGSQRCRWEIGRHCLGKPPCRYRLIAYEQAVLLLCSQEMSLPVGGVMPSPIGQSAGGFNITPDSQRCNDRARCECFWLWPQSQRLLLTLRY